MSTAPLFVSEVTMTTGLFRRCGYDFPAGSANGFQSSSLSAIAQCKKGKLCCWICSTLVL
jgi:hypothetical protein